MPLNTERQVKDFLIDYAVRYVLEDSHCENRHGRAIKDFVEYLKWIPFKERADGKIDVRGMIVDYFESEKPHYFEIKRKLEKLRGDCRKLEALSV